MSEVVTMDLIFSPQDGREVHRVQAGHDELVERTTRAIRKDGRMAPPKGLHLHRESSPTKCVQHSISSIAFCVIAQELGMSTSSFYHHFKAITALSPLQFQKQIRLQEARRLMLGEGLDAAGAGFRVGYNDASHFNREYKKHFGLPPLRDVERLRETTSRNMG